MIFGIFSAVIICFCVGGFLQRAIFVGFDIWLCLLLATRGTPRFYGLLGVWQLLNLVLIFDCACWLRHGARPVSTGFWGVTIVEWILIFVVSVASDTGHAPSLQLLGVWGVTIVELNFDIWLCLLVATRGTPRLYSLGASANYLFSVERNRTS